jgi:hypothetical protein
VRGKGLPLSFTAFFSTVGSGLNSTGNSEEPKIGGMRIDEPSLRQFGQRQFLLLKIELDFPGGYLAEN